jgi:pimeloyl-ACP methyl ester carboxylesterase
MPRMNTPAPRHDAPPLHVRRYGDHGPAVIVVHGGPAACGSAAPLARGLADSFRVLEPWQRGSGGAPLTVVQHVADLHAVIQSCGPGARPALVGESWGAMLVLACAAAHPADVGPLALVGCGTFDLTARAQFQATVAERLGDAGRAALAGLDAAVSDPAERLRRQLALLGPVYDYDPLPPAPADDDTPPFDVAAHEQTWADMLRLQRDGVYPAAFAAIGSPVLMLHGDHDPHPGALIRASLAPHLPQLEYCAWAHCGHRPWHERAVAAEFFAVLRAWLLTHTPA